MESINGSSSRRVIQTADGSKTIHLDQFQESYHSVHGALQEAKHVFIQHLPQGTDHLKILEIGWGTGLNSLLTAQYAEDESVFIHYHGIEAFPVDWKMVQELEYPENLSDTQNWLRLMHAAPWGVECEVHPSFALTKFATKLVDYQTDQSFDVIYFDAFGPRVQPEMWTLSVFQKMFHLCSPGGKLLTYCAKGEVRRNMQAAGFQVEKHPGPPGKREMLVAKKK